MSPFLVMLFNASSDWIKAYADQNNPHPASRRSERLSDLSSEETGGLRRSLMKEEAIADLFSGVDTLQQTVERFRMLNLGASESNATIASQIPKIDPRLPYEVNQTLAFAKNYCHSREQAVQMQYEQLVCEAIAEYAQ